MLRAIICIVVGFSIGTLIARADSLEKKSDELRIENRELRRDIEKLRIKQGKTIQGQA